MPELRTNRGWLGEYMWMKWCYFKAVVYGMFTFKPIHTWEEIDTGMIVKIKVGNKIFYIYGRE